MEKKGFTLIELLAVIIILAIIALISTPVILNVIERANKGAFENSAYGIIDAAKLYYTEASLDGKNNKETFTFPADTKLKLSGKKPSGGSVVLDEDGKIGLAIYNEKWCAVKGKDEEKITIKDYKDGECEVPVVATKESCFTFGGGTIQDYVCEDTKIVIPSKINGVTVTNIGSDAFSNNQLTSVIIPNSIIEIRRNAFYGNKLQSVVIPDSVISIGSYAFEFNQLTSVIIGNNVTSIGFAAFRVNKLTNLVIGDKVDSIGSHAFYNNKLTSVEIPCSVTSIGANAFGLNQSDMTVIVNKEKDSIEGSPWGASSVEWNG